MAGVASGLALATTLMAMQVADSMSTRGCPYRVQDVTPIETQPDHGFLGIRYVFHDGFADVDSIVPRTPAAANHLHRGDHITRINGVKIDSAADLQERIFNSHPHTTVEVTYERNGHEETIRPTLIAWPSMITY
jgi:S1-C subfamily serine protease